MSDQLSKVEPSYCHKCGFLYRTRCDCRIESAAAPVEVELPEPVDTLALEDGFNVIGEQAVFTADQMREYARAYAATLARQLAEAREVHEAFAGDAARRLNEMESALAAATRRVAEVDAYRDATFDGNAVYAALDERAKSRTSADNVADVLDALNRVARAAGEERTPPGSCPCGLTTCDEPWEPGCGLGTVAEFAKVKPE